METVAVQLDREPPILGALDDEVDREGANLHLRDHPVTLFE